MGVTIDNPLMEELLEGVASQDERGHWMIWLWSQYAPNAWTLWDATIKPSDSENKSKEPLDLLGEL